MGRHRDTAGLWESWKTGGNTWTVPLQDMWQVELDQTGVVDVIMVMVDNMFIIEKTTSADEVVY